MWYTRKVLHPIFVRLMRKNRGKAGLYRLVPIFALSLLALAAVVSYGASAHIASAASASVSLPNPIKYDTVQDTIGSLLAYLRNIIVLIALVFLVIGAVLYVTSAGNEARVKTAKRAITAAMVGMAIGIAAPTLLREIADVLQWKIIPPEVLNATRIALILARLLSFLLSIIGVLALIMLVAGGIMYIFSTGDEKRSETGKNIVKYALIGITVALAGLVIVRQIALFFAT